MSDDEDVRGGDVVGAHDGHLLVVRVGHGELSGEDVEQSQRSHYLRLERAESGGGLLEVRELQEEGVQVARRLLDGHAVDQERHDDVAGCCNRHKHLCEV